MADSLQSSFQRIQISEEDLAGAKSAEVKMPILTKSLDATSRSLKLRDVSPVCVLVVGMAGSGKTTLMTSLQRSLSLPVESTDDEGEDDKGEKNSEPVGYCLNLDPATKLVPFGASIDIRDTVDYKEVMKQHRLGPNGAIMTSLNLFATKFDQVISILDNRSYKKEKKSDETPTSSDDAPPTASKALDYILVDTPGQIEAFTWSASGSIITAALASSFPTVLAFVVDTPRCASSLNTFMSNMLYACSMFYRTRLPLIIVFNKCDVSSGEVCMEWMSDYEKFQEAMDDFMASDGAGYYASLTRSLSLVLDEFYQTLHRVCVSAVTGDGIAEFWDVVKKAADDFEEDYVGDLKCRVEEQKARKRALAKDGLNRLKKDIESESEE